MDNTPRGLRLHIALFGRRNTGKSSLINAITRQEIALVSEIPGTTTDPVYKSMELLPVGPVVLIDTAGVDDEGALGELRIRRTRQVLPKTDLALLAVDSGQGVGGYETEIIRLATEHHVPVLGVANKTDLAPGPDLAAWEKALGIPFAAVSALTGEGIEDLKKQIIRLTPQDWTGPAIFDGLAGPGDLVVLVTPIDRAAPKGG
jgi:[FeFe] hydrogenase H-cluster maturation GTPase HydF